MKRVVAFFDMFDEIPENAKYLYSRSVEVPSAESDEEKAARIINGSDTQPPSTIIYANYYEVDDMDFETLMSSGFLSKTPMSKMIEFFEKYQIKTK